MQTPAALTGLIARPGIWVSGILLVVAGALFVFSFTTAGWVFVVLSALNAAFFRNPRRKIPGGPNTVVSPGDGRVVEVARVEDPQGFVGSGWRVAVFLSVCNGHVRRAPIAGKVRGVRRSGNKFLAAFNSKASDLNVQSRIDIESAEGRRVAVVQITGLIARRIMSWPKEGETLERGQLYGLICYGSRMELYLPDDCEISVKPGDRVKGGSSAIGELPA